MHLAYTYDRNYTLLSGISQKNGNNAVVNQSCSCSLYTYTDVCPGSWGTSLDIIHLCIDSCSAKLKYLNSPAEAFFNHKVIAAQCSDGYSYYRFCNFSVWNTK